MKKSAEHGFSMGGMPFHYRFVLRLFGGKRLHDMGLSQL